MRRSVFDASVGLKCVLIEPGTPTARSIRDEFRAGLRELIAPDCYPLECAHALVKAERRGLIPTGQGLLHLASLLTDAPSLHACGPLLIRAFALASLHRIGVYDCLYVALAEREGCEFITADDRLVRALAPAGFPFVVALNAAP